MISYLEQAHVEEELQDCVNGNVEINVHGHPTRPHVLPLLQGVDLLTADHSEDEEHIRSQGNDLQVGEKREKRF